MTTTRRLLLFAHDPGGANTLIPLVRPLREGGFDVLLCGKGPALARYAAHGLSGDPWDVETEEQVAEKLRNIRPDLVLTGTSADDFTEKFLWQQAKTLGITSVAILDQWINYGIRFSEWPISRMSQYEAHPTHAFLPDRIFIMDDFARQEMRAAGFPDKRLVVTGQPYFELVRQGFAEIPTGHARQVRHELGLADCGQVVTFVSEPLSQLYENAEAEFGYTEHSIFSALYQTLAELSPQTGVILKLHPRENPDSYRGFSGNGPKLAVDQTHSPWEIIDASDLVVGMSSMMLIEALIARKPILCVQIGLNRAENPFVLVRRGRVSPILTRESLAKTLRDGLSGSLPKPSPPPFKEDPAERVLKEIRALLGAPV